MLSIASKDATLSVLQLGSGWLKAHALSNALWRDVAALTLHEFSAWLKAKSMLKTYAKDTTLRVSHLSSGLLNFPGLLVDSPLNMPAKLVTSPVAQVLMS